jgi:protein-S-isoprenylcysteine O-methyltransferase Ste14
MGREDTFRVALLVVLVSTLAIAGYHRIQARAAGGSVPRREEGPLLLGMRAVVGLSLWAAMIAHLINPGSMAWSALPAADWLRWGGVGLGLVACALLYWTLHHLGANLTDTVVTRAEATLVTSGPYGWVRHPFYVTVMLILLSASLITANWFIGLLGILTCLFFVLRSPLEEQRLAERFGDDYRAYVQRTGRFLPRHD